MTFISVSFACSSNVCVKFQVGRNVIETIDKLMTLSEKEVEVANVETKAANR